MHAMWKPQKFKYIYLMATLYVFTLTIPSASAVYWAFGDELLDHSNAFSLLPRNGFRDAAVILMLIHQVVTLALLSQPNSLIRSYFYWDLTFFAMVFEILCSLLHLGSHVPRCTSCGRK